jgi:Ca2+-binding EF-hand superfamily protein
MIRTNILTGQPKISEKEALALAETIDEQKTGSINYDDIVNALETK